jgi:hypothetical protein
VAFPGEQEGESNLPSLPTVVRCITAVASRRATAAEPRANTRPSVGRPTLAVSRNLIRYTLACVVLLTVCKGYIVSSAFQNAEGP